MDQTNQNNNLTNPDKPLTKSKENVNPKTVQPFSPLSGEPLQQFSSEYGKYIEFSSLNNSVIPTITDTSEHMLTQLDELSQIVDTVDNNLEQTSSSMKPLLKKTKELQQTFALIDSLDKWISKVNQSVNTMQEQIEQAENQQNSQTIFGIGFPFKKLVEQTPQKPFEPVKLNTKEYFDSLRKDFK